MIRLHTAFLSLGTALAVVSCSGTDANLGSGQEGTNNAGSGGSSADGAAGKDGSAGSGGSAGTVGGGGSANGGAGGNGNGGVGGSGGATTCGTQTCQSTERCCEVPAGTDQVCTPTCVAGPCPGVACHVSTDAGGSTDGSGALTWQVTCGDPVCRVDPGPDSGLPACGTDQKQGSPCASAGEQCDAMLGCGAKLQCADHRLNVACPISSGEFKQGIHYVTGEDLQRLASEVEKIQLTTYTYKDPSMGTDPHLGFIIEDNPESPAVYPNHHKVDLYGYASMAVAALQVQSQQLKAQQRHMDELEEQLLLLRAELRATQNAAPRP